MRRAYVVVGELENGQVFMYHSLCHSMARADELCLEAEEEDTNPEHYYTWHEVIEEDD